MALQFSCDFAVWQLCGVVWLLFKLVLEKVVLYSSLIHTFFVFTFYPWEFYQKAAKQIQHVQGVYTVQISASSTALQ